MKNWKIENQKKEQKPKSKYYSLKNGLCYEVGKGDKIIIYDETNAYKKICEIKIKLGDIKLFIGFKNKDLLIQKEEKIVIYRGKFLKIINFFYLIKNI